MDGITLSGVILLGQSMDMGGSAGDDGRYLNTLPTLAATACYHGKVAAGCSAAGQVDAVNKFIDEEYLHALQAGCANDGRSARLCREPACDADWVVSSGRA